jgi:peptidase E
MPDRHIVAIGGGGFSAGCTEPLLDLYPLQFAARRVPNVCFLATASGDDRQYISAFYHFLGQYDCNISHFCLFNPPTRDFDSFLLTKDVIYVGAGNTRSLLALWREWGIDRILRRAWELGAVLTGVSAGAACWFSQCLSDYLPGEFNPLNGLSFLPGSFCPHYDSQPGRREAYSNMVRDMRLTDGIAIEDGIALHYEDLRLAHVVTSRPAAKAFEIRRREDSVIAIERKPVYVGDTIPIYKP